MRLWCHSPGLSLAVLTSLTFSVGAATAVFTFFDVLLLRPLPMRAPHELYAVGAATGAVRTSILGYFFTRVLQTADRDRSSVPRPVRVEHSRLLRRAPEW